MMTMTARSSSPAGWEEWTRGGAADVPEPIAAVTAVAATFPSLSLSELGGAALMDRVDTKFVVPALSATEILQALGDEYRVLEVSGRRLSRYSTRYFDTPDLRLYHAHHAGRARRYKVRVRTYVDSEARFLEVKLRTSKRRTHKERVSLAHDLLDPVERLHADGLLGSEGEISAHELRESLVVDYTRLTLVRNDCPERVTLDLMLRFSRGGSTRSFPGVMIAEVKQVRRVRSLFLDAMRRMRVREGSLSKYCMGVAALEPAAKCNHFLYALRRLHSIDQGDRALGHA